MKGRVSCASGQACMYPDRSAGRVRSSVQSLYACASGPDALYPAFDDQAGLVVWESVIWVDVRRA